MGDPANNHIHESLLYWLDPDDDYGALRSQRGALQQQQQRGGLGPGGVVLSSAEEDYAFGAAEGIADQVGAAGGGGAWLEGRARCGVQQCLAAAATAPNTSRWRCMHLGGSLCR